MQEDLIRPAPPGPPAPPPHRILVVDDEAAFRQFNVHVLVRAGYAVEAVNDGAAAWDILTPAPYDLVITDNQMPKVTGVELLVLMRDARMKLPVIMATGVMPEETFRTRPHLRPTAMLLKPFTSAELLRVVKEILSTEPDTPVPPPPTPAAAPAPHAGNAPSSLPITTPSGLRLLPLKAAPRLLVAARASHYRLLYAEALAVSGYDVELATDGAAAWEAIQANHYQLVLLEDDLPQVTGLQVVRRLRAAQRELPVIIATGRLTTHDLTADPALRIAATLLRPFAVSTLLNTVENVLRAPCLPPALRPSPHCAARPSAEGLEF